MKDQKVFPGVRPVALKSVSEIERAAARPHRHASMVNIVRALKREEGERAAGAAAAVAADNGQAADGVADQPTVDVTAGAVAAVAADNGQAADEVADQPRVDATAAAVAAVAADNDQAADEGADQPTADAAVVAGRRKRRKGVRP
jgi:hypothetical protein